MSKTKVISELLQNSERTVFRWANENRPIVNLLDKYFSEADLIEFMQSGIISRYENDNIFKNFYKYNFELNNHKLEKFIYSYGISFIEKLIKPSQFTHFYDRYNCDDDFVLFYDEYFNQYDKSFRNFIDDNINSNFSYYLNNIEKYKNDEKLYIFFKSLAEHIFKS